METTYRVLIKGIKADADANLVRTHVAKLFKISIDDAGRILEAKIHVVKGGLTMSKAAQYHSAIEAAGANCMVEPEAPHDLGLEMMLPERVGTTPEIGVLAMGVGGATNTISDNSVKIGEAGVDAQETSMGSRWPQHPAKPSSSAAIKYGVAFLAALAVLGSAAYFWTRPTSETMGATSSASAVPSTTTTNEYSALIDRARNYITEWNQNDPLCDQIESPNLESIQRGKVVFIAMGGGKVDPAIPAIVARIAGTCVVNSLRSREPITKFWMMMAYDKEFQKYTCAKVGGPQLIRSFIEKNCEFVPNPGESGLIGATNDTKSSPLPPAVARQADIAKQDSQPQRGAEVAQNAKPQRRAEAPAIVNNKDATERLAGFRLTPSPIAQPMGAASKGTDLRVACPTQVPPEMPRKAIQDGSEGVVKAQALVKDGAVKEVTILSGPRVFHEVVKAAMMQYKCTADSTEILATQEFVFKIE